MKKITFVLIAVVFLGAAYGAYLYNKPVEDASSKSVDFRMSSHELYQAFQEDEKKANASYLNKIVVVSGEVVRVNDNEGAQNIFLKTDDILSTVSCEMASAIEGASVGDLISIKGECAGFLMDVVLTKCVKNKS